MSNDWYYANRNVRKGPFPRARIDELVEQGTIGPDTLIWGDGMADWAPASEALGLGGVTLDAPVNPQRPVVLVEPGQADDRPPAAKAGPWGAQKAGKQPEPWGKTGKRARKWDGDSFEEREETVAAPPPDPLADPLKPRRVQPTAQNAGPAPRAGKPHIFRATVHGLSNAFNFRGRDLRWQFWYFALAIWLVGLLTTNFERGLYFDIWVEAEALMLVWSAVIAVPFVAAAIRRFHDTGLSGSYALLFLLPGIGWFIAAILLARGSDAAVNEYGPRPVRG